MDKQRKNIKIETVLKKEIFYNSENGYAVFKDEQERIFTGYLFNKPDKLKNINVLIECKRVKTKYGIQYQIKNIEYQVPPLYHFLIEVIKGVQKKAAIELAERYQNISKLEEILLNNEKEILKIKGIGPKSIEKLKKGVKQDKDLYQLAEILLPYGVSSNIIRKIYGKYKNKAVIEKLKKDPYSVLTSVRGIGFKKADDIALKANLAEKNSIYRAKAAILYSMEQILNEDGDTVFEKDIIRKKFYELIDFVDIEENKFNEAFDSLVNDNKIIPVDEEKRYFTFSNIHYIEWSIFKYVKENSFSFVKDYNKSFIDIFIKKYEMENNIIFDEKQKKAITDFLLKDSPIYIIAGYAGTGKTTVSKALVKFLKTENKKVVGCALSGAAANRLKSVTGIDSYTIHSLLGYRKGKGSEDSIFENMFRYNSSNKLDYDLIILDEASMVGTPLIYHLLKAVNPKKTKILMLGDDAQLPPVGWGEVFSDLLNYEEVPKIKLTKIFRQKKDKVITLFASEIRKGNVPKNYKDNKYSDFNFVSINIPGYMKNMKQEEKKIAREKNNIKIRNYILSRFQYYKDSILKNLNEYKETKNTEFLKKYLSRIQLISAVKNGILGTYEMNISIKNILNPIFETQKEGINYILIKNNKMNINKYFSIFDKVIHLKNQDMFCSDVQISDIDELEDKIYETTERIYNGQSGIITNIISKFNRDGVIDNTYIEVFYPNENYYVYYEKTDFYNEIIDLSYAITIHKSQGQEYESVIIPITFSHFIMLNAKLMYTAITRAKDRVILIGENGAFNMACKKLEDVKRNTNLKYLIKQEIENKNINEKENNVNKKKISDIDILPF